MFSFLFAQRLSYAFHVDHLEILVTWSAMSFMVDYCLQKIT